MSIVSWARGYVLVLAVVVARPGVGQAQGSQAERPQLKPGLWELTNRTDSAGVRDPSSMKLDPSPPTSATSTVCKTAQDLAQDDLLKPVHRAGDKSCHPSVISRDPYSFHQLCGEKARSDETTIKIQDSEHFEIVFVDEIS